MFYFLKANVFCVVFVAFVLWNPASCAAPPGGAQALQQLTEFRKSHRRTVDGRLCAAAFVQDDQTYTDCTAAKAPNGTAGADWCYVEVQLLGKGASDWNYCLPPISYDKVRVKARQAFEMKAAEGEAMIKRLDGSIYQADLAAKKLEALCGKRHEAAERQLETARNIFLRNQNCLKRLFAAAAKAKNLKELIKETRSKVQQQQAAAAQQPENCLGALGYEEDPVADGLRGAYFDNCCFEGPPRVRKIDQVLDFAFSGSGPLEGLKAHNYSIRWDGFLQVPETGHYVFTTETDNGVRVFLNGQPVVADRMPGGSPAESSGSKRVSLLSAVQKSGKHFSNSAKLRLIRKKKYKIRVEFVHNPHFLPENSDRGTLRLLWSSEDLPREVIPSKFFFSSDRPSPLKVSSLDPALHALSLLLQGAPAFADTAAFELQQIPQHLKGLRFLLSRRRPSEALMEFYLKSPAALFVAFPLQQPFPLAPFEDYLWRAQDTPDRIFVKKRKDNFQTSSPESAQEGPGEKTEEEPTEGPEKTEKETTERPESPEKETTERPESPENETTEGPESPEKETTEGPESPEKETTEGPESPEKETTEELQESFTLQVKRIIHRGGPVSLSVAHKGVPFLVILAPLEDAAACGGEEVNLSLSAGPHLLGCSSSSELSADFNCKSGLSGIHLDGPGGIWKSRSGNGNGESISVEFARPVQLSKFRFMPPSDPLTWPSELTLTFDENDSEVFSILHSNKLEHHEYLLPAAKTVTRVKVEITQMFVNGGDSGGSFEFWGVPCLTAAAAADAAPAVLELECLDTLATALHGQEAPPGSHFVALCAAACLQEPLGPVYGTKVFALESCVCSAARHSGVCTPGAACAFLLSLRGPQSDFAAAVSHGVASLAHGPAALSLAFSHAACTHSLLQQQQQQQKLQIHFGATGGQPLPPGWLQDEGGLKKRRGEFYYGWLREAAAPPCEAPQHFPSPLNNGGLVLSHAAAAEAGAATAAAAAAAANFWSLSVPLNGRYLVAAEVGNCCGVEGRGGAAAANLEVNGIPLLRNLQIQEKAFYVASVFVEVKEKIILLTAACEGEKCSKALTTLFNVVVQKL